MAHLLLSHEPLGQRGTRSRAAYQRMVDFAQDLRARDQLARPRLAATDVTWGFSGVVPGRFRGIRSWWVQEGAKVRAPPTRKEEPCVS